MKHSFHFGIITGAMALVSVTMALALAGCGKEEKKSNTVQAAKAEPIAIKTVRVEEMLVDRTISATGALAADETVAVSSEVQGRITSILVDFGAYVSKGQVVAQLDTRELQIALDRVKSNQAQVLARIGLRPDQLNAQPDSSPAVRLALAQYEDVKSKYERTATLLKTGDVAEEREVEAEKLLRAREAQLQQARDELRNQLAQVEGLKVEQRFAEKRLADATLRAPIDGIVTERLAAPGQFIKENVALMTLVRQRPLRLRVEIPQDSTGFVRPGTTLTFTTDAAPEKEFKAQVSRLDAVLNSQSRALQVEARVSDPDTRLRPGVFVTVRLVSQKNLPISVVVPQAIVTVAGLTKVYVVQGNKVVERKITPGETRGDKVEIPGDLKPGTMVAASALGRLSNNAEVKVEGK